MSDWSRAGYEGYQPKSEEEVRAIEDVLEMVRDFMAISDRGERIVYLRGIDRAMEGRRVDYAKAMCFLSLGDERRKPFIEMLEIMEGFHDKIYVTNGGRFSQAMLDEAHARRIGDVIQFPISIQWRVYPDYEKGIEGVVEAVVYPPPPPVARSREMELGAADHPAMRAPWEYGE